MDPAEYDKLDRLEDRMWWFAATHANLIMLAHRFGPSAAPRRILDAGCRLLYASYWNIVMFPLMVIAREMLPSRGATGDVRAYSAPMEALGRAATARERFSLQAGWHFPFGGSLVAVAAKPAES